MSGKLRFGLVGAGGMGQSYARALEQGVEAQLVAVVDVRRDAAQALAESVPCEAFDCCDAMFDGTEVDAVVVVTPPNTHHEVCLSALRRKRHVLCEKPLCIDVGQAVEMVDTAAAEGVKLTMASKFRYVDDVVRAKSIVESGILGDIILFENTFASRVNMASRWNAQPEISGGGVLIDNGTHSLDIVRYFFGSIAEVQVVEGKRSQGLAVEETVQIFVRTESGVMGNIDLSWSIDKQRDSYINLYGAQGTVSVGWKESRYRQVSSPDWVVFGKGYDKIAAIRRQINNFCRAIRGEERLLITPSDAVASVEAMEAAYHALHHSHWTTVSAGAQVGSVR